jgi:hypothetical protein
MMCLGAFTSIKILRMPQKTQVLRRFFNRNNFKEM